MEHPLLLDLTILFGAALAASYLFRLLRLSTLTGFLVAGAAIGPGGTGLIASADEVREMEEIGVILLLFSIGVEFSVGRLRQSSWTVLAGGGGQVLATGVLAGSAAALLTGSARIGIFAGMLTALSSTVIGLRLLHEQGQTMAPQGHVSLSILIFQDIAVLPMMLFLPFVTGNSPADLLSLLRTLSVSALAILAILAIARLVVPRLIGKTVEARSRDVFILSVIVTVVGVAWVASRFGVSAGLGAFVAGLVISESEYSHQVFSDVLPFRETFNSLFFVSVGMLIDPAFVWGNLPTIAGLTAVVMLMKTAVGTGVVRLLGYPLRIALAVGLLLSQVGEFSIVLLRAAETDGLLGTQLEQLALATILFTMVLSTLLQRIPAWIPDPGSTAPTSPSGPIPEFTDHTVLVGYGLNGRNVAALLDAFQLPYAVLELNPRTVRKRRAEGLPIFYGDAISETVLEALGAARARAVVFAISDPVATRHGVAAARRLSAEAYILARTRYEAEIEPLYRAGADTVIAEEFETSLTIIRRLLDRMGIHPSRVDRAILDIRQQHYDAFRRSEMQGVEIDPAIRVFEGVVRQHADGGSIGDLGIRLRSGATVVAVERNGRVVTNPGPDFVLREGDRVHLIGSEHEVGRALRLI